MERTGSKKMSKHMGRNGGRKSMGEYKHKTCGMTKTEDVCMGRVGYEISKRIRNQIIKDLMP